MKTAGDLSGVPITGVHLPKAEAGAGAVAGRAASALFAGLLVAGALPVWVVSHVPTQDGMQHVESVMALLALPHSPLLQHFYVANWGPQPNWLTQMLFAGLVQVFPPLLAEKLVLTGYLVLLPVAFRYALPPTPRGRWAALTVFPFLHSYPFHMGFWNFCYSLVLFFVAVGMWYRTRGRFDLRRGLAFTGVTTVLFVAHAVSISAAFAVITAILAWRAGAGVLRARGDPARRARIVRGYLRRAAATYLFALPSIVLLAVFFVRQPEPISYRPSLFDYAKHFFSLYGLVSFDRRELLLTGAVAVVIAGTVALALRARGRRLRTGDGWLAAAALMTALYFLTPDAVADGAQVTDRLNLYPYLTALLWLGWSSVPVRRVRLLALALAAVFVAGTTWRVAKYREIDGYLDEMMSAAAAVPEGSVILPLTFAPFGPREGGSIDGRKLLSYRIEVLRHAVGYLAVERNAVELDNSQANTHHAPIRWRHALNPFASLPTRRFGIETEPPCVELWPYPERIDRALVVGATAATAQDECGGVVLRELAQDYERVFVSRPRGLVEVYRPRRGAPAAPR